MMSSRAMWALILVFKFVQLADQAVVHGQAGRVHSPQRPLHSTGLPVYIPADSNAFDPVRNLAKTPIKPRAAGVFEEDGTYYFPGAEVEATVTGEPTPEELAEQIKAYTEASKVNENPSNPQGQPPIQHSNFEVNPGSVQDSTSNDEGYYPQVDVEAEVTPERRTKGIGAGDQSQSPYVYATKVNQEFFRKGQHPALPVENPSSSTNPGAIDSAAAYRYATKVSQDFFRKEHHPALPVENPGSPTNPGAIDSAAAYRYATTVSQDSFKEQNLEHSTFPRTNPNLSTNPDTNAAFRYTSPVTQDSFKRQPSHFPVGETDDVSYTPRDNAAVFRHGTNPNVDSFSGKRPPFHLDTKDDIPHIPRDNVPFRHVPSFGREPKDHVFASNLNSQSLTRVNSRPSLPPLNQLPQRFSTPSIPQSIPVSKPAINYFPLRGSERYREIEEICRQFPTRVACRYHLARAIGQEHWNSITKDKESVLQPQIQSHSGALNNAGFDRVSEHEQKDSSSPFPRKKSGRYSVKHSQARHASRN